jgi:pimeloyl-ACP methyl ester carboxylesterase
VKLRLFHHRDGARVAYREAGTGPPLVLLHAALLTHREMEPLAEPLCDRFRVVLPDLPLHGDSEDRPRHPYSPAWFAEVVAAFCTDVGGPRPLVGGHGLGGDVLVDAVVRGLLAPSKLVLLPCGLHRTPVIGRWRGAARVAGLPGADRVAGHLARRLARPAPEARDLVGHALADVGGNTDLARSWRRFAGAWPRGPRRELLDDLPQIACPTLLLWADGDERHPLTAAEEARDLLPDAVLRVLPGTGALPTVDDPVGVAREIRAFCL